MEKFVVKKKFGQNFLNNEGIIKKIANSIDTKSDDLIIEIGPGKGALTKELVKKDGHLIAFEIDTDTKPYLEPLISDKFQLIYDDFLNIDLNKFLKDYQYHNLNIIANLPYYITTPIISKIIDSNEIPNAMSLMVQKEVADRFTANPGSKDYGYFTLKINYFFDTKKIIDVNRKYFNPAPNVDSAVVNFVKKEYDLDLYSDFEKIIKEAFRMKRKTLKNNLGNELFNKILPTLMNHGYGADVRAEQIDLDTFIELAKIK